jgi:dihydroorotase
MLISIILLAIASLQAVLAHTVFTTLFIDDVNQGDATCVRMPTVGATCTAPIIDLTSNDMACGKVAPFYYFKETN